MSRTYVLFRNNKFCIKRLVKLKKMDTLVLTPYKGKVVKLRLYKSNFSGQIEMKISRHEK